MRHAGADLVTLPVYRWTLPEDPDPAVRLAEALISGRVEAVTFTAGASPFE
jgi:uroporphyrinogen-III synthase